MNKQGLVNRMCAYNKAISDPNRMKMIKILGSNTPGTVKVGDIAEILGISQPAATKHLHIMEEVGLFDRKREGTSVYYSLNEGALAEYRQELDWAFEHGHTPCTHDYKCDECPVAETCM